MSIRRVVPDIASKDFDASRAFYRDFLGLELAMDMGLVMTFVSSTNPTAQITIVDGNDPSAVRPDVSIEVGNVDEVYAQAVRLGVPIVYPLTNEPWGVRRFFVAEPNGKVLNILTHLRSRS